jgi:hypothetical protein
MWHWKWFSTLYQWNQACTKMCERWVSQWWPETEGCRILPAKVTLLTVWVALILFKYPLYSKYAVSVWHSPLYSKCAVSVWHSPFALHHKLLFVMELNYNNFSFEQLMINFYHWWLNKKDYRIVNATLALQVHFLAIAKGIATFGASSTGRVKMVVVSSLHQHRNSVRPP